MTTATERDDSGPADFFIPDLCLARSVFFAVLLSELSVLIFVLASSSLPAINWGQLAGGSLFTQWVVLSSSALLCLSRTALSRLSLVAATAAALAIILLVTLITSLIALRLFPVTSGDAAAMWVLRNVLVVAVLAGMVLRYFYLQQQLRWREQSEMQARLDALRSRMRPHFLFNTMNSIASLIASRPEDAERVVEDLSELFRVSLQDHSADTTLRDELYLCDLYLRIEQVRLGQRLQVAREVEDSVLNAFMPSLILQPLVENAVYHGISRIPEGGTVTITISGSNDCLRATVRNPQPDSQPVTSGHQMALANIRQRLAGLYGDDGQLTITEQGAEFVVELCYPLELVGQ